MSGRTWMTLLLAASLALGGRGWAAPAPSQPPEPSAAYEAYTRGLLAALEDPEDEVVARALLALDLGIQDLPELRERLQDFLRTPRAARALAQPGSSLGRAVLITQASVDEAPPDTARFLVDLLAVKEQDPAILEAAQQALGRMGEAARGQAPRLVELMKGPEVRVSAAAARALGKMGGAAREQVPALVDLLKPQEKRLAALEALEALGEAAGEQAPRVGALLKDPDYLVRGVAARVLGGMGEAAREQVPALVEVLLKDPKWDVSRAAAFALGNLGEVAREQVPRLRELLKSPDTHDRGSAVMTLGFMGEGAREALPDMGELLKDPVPEVRGVAVEALMELAQDGVVASAQAPRIGELLEDPVPEVRGAALKTLGYMGEAARDSVPAIVRLMADPKQPALLGGTAAVALMLLGEVASPQLPRLLALLDSPDPLVRQNAVIALWGQGEGARRQSPRIARFLEDPSAEVRQYTVGTLGKVGAREYAPGIAGLLEDPNPSVREQAAVALGQLGAREQIPQLIAHVDEEGSPFNPTPASPAWLALASMTPLEPEYVALLAAEKGKDPAQRARWLARAHGLGAGAPEVERVLRWLGGRPPAQLPSEKQLSLEDARLLLQDFARLWPAAERFPVLADELSQQIAQVAMLGRGRWRKRDRALLELHEQNLLHAQPLRAPGVRAALDSIPLVPRGAVAGAVAVHAGFWLLLLGVYPRSAKVQALFFWNPWVRRILGLGYVGVLLTWVPFLRRRLLSPFQRLLVVDAGLERFSPEGYFARSEVLGVATGQRRPLLEALPRVRGLVVLEGASGLGKSMFIRHLLCRSRALAVYLPAEACKQGVLEAIQVKLEGLARDTGFLHSLIYSGALDIYIDGLNEVSADTRTRIVRFVEPKFRGNILLATQRMEWRPPATASRYELQPLTEAQVREFLLGREPLLSPAAPVRGEAYRKACEDFLSLALAPGQKEWERAMREVLSNPMDLTVVAQLLSEKQTPDLFHLQEQQYALMARDYEARNGEPFPLEKLCEEAYQMRLEDRSTLAKEAFAKELPKLEAYKLVVRREWLRPDGKAGSEWHFRHDKLWDFFIVQRFLGQGNERIHQHVDDPRFRGVYFLLARLMKPEDALALQDQLVEHAAETQDHTVSDAFVTLVQARIRAARASASTGPPSHGGNPGP